MQENGTIFYQRITADMIPKFKNQYVTLVGKITESDQNHTNFLVDGTNVEVLGIEEVPQSDQDILLEIRGQLTSDCKLDVKEFTEIDEGFDFQLYKKVITLVQDQFRDLFYD